MDFNQDLRGMVYTGQQLARPKKEIDITHVWLDTLTKMTLDDWKNLLPQSNYRMASMPEVYNYFKAVMSGAKNGIEDCINRQSQIDIILNEEREMLFTSTITHFKDGKIDITYDYAKERKHNHAITNIISDESFQLSQISDASHLRYVRKIFGTQDSPDTITETLTGILKKEAPYISIWTASQDHLRKFPKRHICITNDSNHVIGAHVYGLLVRGHIIKVLR